MAWADIFKGVVGALNTGAKASVAGQRTPAGTSLYGGPSAAAGPAGSQQAVQAATPIGYGTGSMYGQTTVDPRTRQMQFQFGQNPFAQLMNVGGSSPSPTRSRPGAATVARPLRLRRPHRACSPGLEQEAAGRLGILRQLAQPEEQRASNQLTDRLFASGRLGGTGGAVEQKLWPGPSRQRTSSASLLRRTGPLPEPRTAFSLRYRQSVPVRQARPSSSTWAPGRYGGLSDMFKMLLQQGNVGLGAASATPSDIAALQAGAKTAPVRSMQAQHGCRTPSLR